MMWIGIAAAVGVPLVAAASAVAFGMAHWRAASRAALARLSSGTPPAAPAFNARELDGLPAPVVQYFRTVLRLGQPVIAAARVTQRGEFHTGNSDNGWHRFDAIETFDPPGPGFVWLARIRMAPGLNVEVRDAYLRGAGAMRATVCGVLTMADAHDTPEMAAGALQRYLAEAPWFPTALLPSQGVVWSPIGDTSARATLTHGATTVSIDFTFNDRGEIVRAWTPTRYRFTKHGFDVAPWAGTFAEYAERQGVRIPLQAEVAWETDGRREPYWRGRVTQVEYDLAPVRAARPAAPAPT